MTTRAKTLNFWLMGLLAVGCVAGCSKENEVGAAGDRGTTVPGAIGNQCSGPDDPACGVASVCVLGYCRSSCTTDAECPTGTICVGDAPPWGCQLPSEARCNDTDEKCAAPLLCGADGTCRMPCSATQACPRNEQTCISGTCVGKSESSPGAIAIITCADRQGKASFGPCVAATTCTSARYHPDHCAGLVPAEAPAAQVQVGAYGIDATEVTRSQYLKFVYAVEREGYVVQQPDRCGWNDTVEPTMPENLNYAVPIDPIDYWPPLDRPNHPVVCVDFCDAHAYCKWAGKRLCGGIGGGPNSHENVVNAGASQWYNACSSGGKNKYPYGNTYDSSICNVASGALAEVGSFSGCQPIETPGVFDLVGNVFEWEDECSLEAADQQDICRVRGGPVSMVLNGSPPPEEFSCDLEPWGHRRNLHELYIGFRCCSDP